MSPPGRPLRILHAPVDLGGHPRQLAAAQRSLGHDARCISLAWSAFGFNGDMCFDAPPGTRLRLAWREVGRLRLFVKSLLWADVVHCHFGQGILSVRPLPLRDPDQSGLREWLTVGYARLAWMLDFRLWRRLGKTVAMTFNGDDIRLTDLAKSRGRWSHLHLPELASASEPRDQLKRRQVDLLQQLGVAMFATNPDLLAGLPDTAQFQPYAHVDPRTVKVTGVRPTGRLRVLHMPTHRDIKGSAFFRQAVDRLKAGGLDVELTLVEGRSNAEALAALDEHDVLLDQLRVGWYGAVAVEAMARGKPVIAYINEADLSLAPPDLASDMPIVTATPETIEEVLLNLLVLPREQLVALGLKSRRFAERWHDPIAVARQTLAAYGVSA